MARIQFTVTSPRTPDEVRAALVDFSSDRPALWPAIDAGVYRVHALGESWADVTEGSAVMGGIWARECYDWSAPDVVRATLLDSNVWHPGGTWELRTRPDADGGSVLEVTRDRRARNLKGRALEALLRVAGRAILAADLRKAPAISDGTARGIRDRRDVLS